MTLGEERGRLSTAVLLKVWSPDGQSQHHLGADQNADSRPRPRSTESETVGVGPSFLCFNKTPWVVCSHIPRSTVPPLRCQLWLKFVKLEKSLQSIHRKELKCFNNNKHLLSSYCIPGTMLSTLPASFRPHNNTIKCRYYYYSTLQMKKLRLRDLK